MFPGLIGCKELTPDLQSRLKVTYNWTISCLKIVDLLIFRNNHLGYIVIGIMTLGLWAQPSVFHQFSRNSLCTVGGPTSPLKKSWEISSHLTFDTLISFIPNSTYLTLSSGSCWRNLYFSFGWTSSSVKSFGITSVFNSLYLLWILKTITNEKVYPANRRGNKSFGFKLLGVILKRNNNY